VVQPPALVRGPGTPMLRADRPSGTVIASAKVALSEGWSLTGNQVLADSGWPRASAPSAPLLSQPPSPRVLFASWPGVPP
jgi:hypothetical protein